MKTNLPTGMSVIYLTYANKEDQPLRHLKAEAEAINQLLTDRKLQNHFLLEIDPFTNVQKIAYYINKYRDRLIFFGFSGHAGKDVLFTEEETAHAQGIAQLLGQCPQLKVVFLNGCSTAGQVKGLLNLGVKAVIATHTPIEDELAKHFADHLFQALNEQQTLKVAFEHAKSVVEALNKTQVFTQQWGFDFELKDTHWGLFWQDKAVLGWTLPTEAQDYRLNTLLQAHAGVEAPKVFFIVDEASKEKFYLKIKNSFRKELESSQLIFNDLLAVSRNISREGTLTEVENADVLIFMVNGLDFFNFWEQISWIKEAILQFEKPVVFIKLSGDDQPLEELAEELGRQYDVLPEYRDMFQVLPSSELEKYIVNGFRGELKNQVQKSIQRKGVAPEKLKEELLDFDLGPQSGAFKDFLNQNWRYNLALIQGTDRCGQGLLLNRLVGYLPNKFLRYDIDFAAVEAPVKEESHLWVKLSEYLVQSRLDNPEWIVPILADRLKNQDVLIVLEHICTSEMTNETASANMRIVSAFWKKATALLPHGKAAPAHALYIFAINRACQSGMDFGQLDMAGSNPIGNSILLQINPIDEAIFSDWHQEKRRRFPEPEFNQLPDHVSELVSDGYLSDVILRICEFLNCKSVHAKLRA